MLWWYWAVLGLFLAALEILTPGGFYLLFFGVGGLAVAVLTWVGLGGPVWFQVLLFSVFSIISVMLFRNPLLRMMQRKSRAQSARPNCAAPRGPRATAAPRRFLRAVAARWSGSMGWSLRLNLSEVTIWTQH
jgi:hypothetical protein